MRDKLCLCWRRGAEDPWLLNSLCLRLWCCGDPNGSKAKVKLFEWLGVGHDGEASLGGAKFSGGVSLQGVAPVVTEAVDVARPPRV